MVSYSSQTFASRHTRLARYFSTLDLSRSKSTHTRWQPLACLKKPSLIDFQQKAFQPSKPYHLVSSFDLPASARWINETTPTALNAAYFQPFQDELYLPLELTMDGPPATFTRTKAPLSIFLDYLGQVDSDVLTRSSMPRMYIAQAPLDLLPSELRKDIPTPDFVLKAGKGDIYDSSLWAGPSDAARTPLHHDPNPNILVQVAGTKVVRLLPPQAGAHIYRGMQAGSITGTTTTGPMGTMRGEEMMGQEGRQLDRVIWEGPKTLQDACEAILQPGDGIFIPNGWWHSIRSIGNDFNISINWWFR